MRPPAATSFDVTALDGTELPDVNDLATFRSGPAVHVPATGS